MIISPSLTSSPSTTAGSSAQRTVIPTATSPLKAPPAAHERATPSQKSAVASKLTPAKSSPAKSQNLVEQYRKAVKIHVSSGSAKADQQQTKKMKNASTKAWIEAGFAKTTKRTSPPPNSEDEPLKKSPKLTKSNSSAAGSSSKSNGDNNPFPNLSLLKPAPVKVSVAKLNSPKATSTTSSTKTYPILSSRPPLLSHRPMPTVKAPAQRTPSSPRGSQAKSPKAVSKSPAASKSNTATKSTAAQSASKPPSPKSRASPNKPSSKPPSPKNIQPPKTPSPKSNQPPKTPSPKSQISPTKTPSPPKTPSPKIYNPKESLIKQSTVSLKIPSPKSAAKSLSPKFDAADTPKKTVAENGTNGRRRSSDEAKRSPPAKKANLGGSGGNGSAGSASSIVIDRRLSAKPVDSKWKWSGTPELKTVHGQGENMYKCYPSIKHEDGDVIRVRDCVLVKSGPRKKDIPYVAKIATLWEVETGEMMMSVLWYYRPEQTDSERLPIPIPREVFASRHRDVIPVACIDDRCFVLTCNEWCRHCAEQQRRSSGQQLLRSSYVPELTEAPTRRQRLPSIEADPDTVFMCRKVYDVKLRRILKNPQVNISNPTASSAAAATAASAATASAPATTAADAATPSIPAVSSYLSTGSTSAASVSSVATSEVSRQHSNDSPAAADSADDSDGGGLTIMDTSKP